MAKKTTGFQKLALTGFAISAVALIVNAHLLSKNRTIVRGKSGKSWVVTMLKNVGGLKTYEIASPAGTFGPHGDLSVLVYSQKDADVSSRAVVAIGQGVPVAIIKTAGTDFSIPIDPARLPAS